MKLSRFLTAIILILFIAAGLSQAAVTMTTSSGLNLTTGDVISGTLSNGADSIGFSINNVQMPKTGDDGANFNDLSFVKSPANWNWFSRDNGSPVLETYSFELNVTTGEQVKFTFSPSGVPAGNNNTSVFTVTWGISGSATIVDPDNQLNVVSNGNGSATFKSAISFLANDEVTWSVTTGATTKVFFDYEENPDNGATQQERMGILDFTVIDSSGQASAPNPPSGETGVSITPTLTWTPGDSVQATGGHDLFMGTSYNEVIGATTSSHPNVIYVNLSDASYTPGTLDYATEYFWRVDEINGAQVWNGPVWGFTTDTGQASNPSPQNTEQEVNHILTLTWTEGNFVQATDGHEIYIGTSQSAVTNATKTSHPDVDLFITSDASLNPGILDFETPYYWRVDEINTSLGYIWKGDTWTFDVREGNLIAGFPEVSLAYPTFGLAWTKPDDLDNPEYDLYLGTDQTFSTNILELTGLTSPVYSGSIDLLTPSTTYYWRIDTVGSVYGPSQVYTGPTWQFTTDEYFSVHEFDDYADTASLVADWSDGSTNGSGAVVSISQESDGKALLLNYDNAASPYDSHTQYVYDSPADWTLSGVKSLYLEFFGDVSNTAGIGEQLYVILEDAAGGSGVVRYGDMPAENLSDIQQTDTWNTWNLSLEEFAAQGVDLSQISEIVIAFGAPQAVQPGGAGSLVIDKLRLYPSRCLAAYLPGDLTGDCQVTFDDFVQFVPDWMDGDYQVDAVMPSDSALRVYYSFNETGGSQASDDSDNTFHGTVRYVYEGTEYLVTDGWDANGYAGGCLDFDGRFGVLVPSGVFSTIDDAMTFSVWISDNDENLDVIEQVLFGAGPTDETQWDTLSWNPQEVVANKQTWNHVGVVKDAVAGRLSIYFNGRLVAQDQGSQTINGTGVGTTAIGSWADGTGGFFKGKMDELRIYDTALTHEQIVYLATGAGQSVVQPLYPVITEADMNRDGAVNIRDFIHIGREWLDDPNWP